MESMITIQNEDDLSDIKLSYKDYMYLKNKIVTDFFEVLLMDDIDSLKRSCISNGDTELEKYLTKVVLVLQKDPINLQFVANLYKEYKCYTNSDCRSFLNEYHSIINIDTGN